MRLAGPRAFSLIYVYLYFIWARIIALHGKKRGDDLRARVRLDNNDGIDSLRAIWENLDLSDYLAETYIDLSIL